MSLIGKDYSHAFARNKEDSSRVIASSERAKQSHIINCRGLIHQTHLIMMRLPNSLRLLAMTYAMRLLRSLRSLAMTDNYITLERNLRIKSIN